jgi:uncharacterized membrane protein YhaH (DUF805 family)
MNAHTHGGYAGQPTAGWYEDPHSGDVRYWDGAESNDQWPASPFAQAGPTPTAMHDSRASWDGRSDLDGAPMGPVAAVVSGFKNMFVLRGRASRSAYWWFWIFQVPAALVVMIFVGMIAFSINPQLSDSVMSGLFLVAIMPFWFAQITLGARRLHDSGLSAHFLWILLIPYVGVFVVLGLLLRGSRDPNPYGAW